MDLIFKEEAYAIQGAAFEVYREMGCGFLEAVCQAIHLTTKYTKHTKVRVLKLNSSDLQNPQPQSSFRVIRAFGG